MEFFQQNCGETVGGWKFSYDSYWNSRINIPAMLIMSHSISVITDYNQCDNILLLHYTINGYHVIREHNHSPLLLYQLPWVHFLHLRVFQVCLLSKICYAHFHLLLLTLPYGKLLYWRVWTFSQHPLKVDPLKHAITRKSNHSIHYRFGNHVNL